MRVTSKHLTNEHEGKTRGGSNCPDECGMVGIAPWCLKISTELPPEASKAPQKVYIEIKSKYRQKQFFYVQYMVLVTCW